MASDAAHLLHHHNVTDWIGVERDGIAIVKVGLDPATEWDRAARTPDATHVEVLAETFIVNDNFLTSPKTELDKGQWKQASD